MKLGCSVIASCALVIACGPPPVPEYVKHENDVTVTIVNHTPQPICRVWRELTSEWLETWAAKSPAECLAPGKSTSVTVNAYDLKNGGSEVAAATERFEVNTPPPHSYQFNLGNGGGQLTIDFEPRTYKDLRSETTAFDAHWEETLQGPATIESFPRLVADKKEAEHREAQHEKREEAKADREHAERKRQARAECFSVQIPKAPPARLPITGKWSCSGDGMHASLRILGDAAKMSLTEDLFTRRNHFTFDMNGEIHGAALFALSDESFAQLQKMSGGLQVQQNILMDDACVKVTLLCTR